MSLTLFRLDPAGLRGLVVGLAPAIRDGKQRQTKEGVLEWNVSLLVRGEEQLPETIAVRVASATEPKVPDLSEVELVDPVGRLYTMTGRRGFSVSASGIRPVGQTRAVPGAAVVEDGKVKASA